MCPNRSISDLRCLMPGFDVGLRIERVADLVVRGRRRHQLHQPHGALGRLRPGLVVRLDLDQRPDQQRIDAVRLGHRRDDLAVGRRSQQRPPDRGLASALGCALGGGRGSGYGTSSRHDLLDQRLVARDLPAVRSVRTIESPSIAMALDRQRPARRSGTTISARAPAPQSEQGQGHRRDDEAQS